MIDFEEELKKFHPCLEVGDVEDAVYHLNTTDAADLFVGMLQDAEAAAQASDTVY